jgi:protein O-GlcNAc transferase
MNLESLTNLAEEKRQQGQLAEAESLYRQILATQSDNARLLFDLGNLFQEQQRFTEAIAVYQQVAKLQSDRDLASLNQACLGDAYLQQYLLDEAAHAYQQSIELDSNRSQVYCNLGYVWQSQGKGIDAEHALREAIELDPNLTIAHKNLGCLLNLQKKESEAIEALEKAIELDSNFLLAYNNLGKILVEQGKNEEAIEVYDRSLKINPNHLYSQICKCMSQLAVIYSDPTAVESSRQKYQQQLQALSESLQQVPTDKLDCNALGAALPFFLAYQGKNDRQLQQIYGEMVCSVMSRCYPQWNKSLPIPKLEKGEKIRIGFVSAFFRNHSNWKVPIQGWLEQLDRDCAPRRLRDRFEIYGYHINSLCYWDTAQAIEACDKFVQGPFDLEKQKS